MADLDELLQVRLDTVNSERSVVLLPVLDQVRRAPDIHNVRVLQSLSPHPRMSHTRFVSLSLAELLTTTRVSHTTTTTTTRPYAVGEVLVLRMLDGRRQLERTRALVVGVVHDSPHFAVAALPEQPDEQEAVPQDRKFGKHRIWQPAPFRRWWWRHEPVNDTESC